MGDVKTELAVIRERVAAATEGPWTAEYSGEQGNCVIPNDAQSTREAVAITRLYHQQGDAEFIAHARTDVPRLVAALEAVAAIADEWDRMWHACPEGCCGSPEAQAIREAITAALTTEAPRDHCDGGCINPGSGDCPTCKAAASEGPTDG